MPFPATYKVGFPVLTGAKTKQYYQITVDYDKRLRDIITLMSQVAPFGQLKWQQGQWSIL